MKKAKEIEFDLLENGLDFIENSLKPILESQNEHELKYSVLHISAGTELILKEILKTEHWSLIFENVNKANYMHLRTGEFESASYETIISRLENIADISISGSAQKYIRELRKKRNRIEHFAFKEIDVAIKSTVSKVLSHIIEIIKDNLDIKQYSARSQDLYKNILKKSAKFNEFTTLTKAKLAKDLEILKDEKVRILDCPECLQHTFPLDGNLRCLFCGYSDKPDNVAFYYTENILDISHYATVKDGDIFPVVNCPECKTESLVGIMDSYICFSCLAEWDREDLRYCDWCSQLYPESDDDFGMCDDCKEYQIYRHRKD